MSETLKIYNQNGEAVGEFVFEDQYLEFDKGAQAVHDVVVAYRAGLRAGSACTQTRAEVNATGSKPFRQKGTGRARAGSVKSPVWTGGDVVFGPKPRSYEKRVNKKVKALALRRAISDKVKEQAITIVDKIELPDHKTKGAVNILKNLKLADRKVLIVTGDYEENLLRATGNMPKVLLMKGASVNVYQVLFHDAVLFTEEAIKEFVAARLR